MDVILEFYRRNKKVPVTKQSLRLSLVFSLAGGGVIFATAPVQAQAPLPAPVQMPSANTLNLNTGLARYFDTFSGQDKPGPYTLTWNNLRVTLQEAIVVTVDGNPLPNDGFTVNRAKGEITFAAPLKAASIARVTYSYEPTVSQRNPNAATAPVTLPGLRAFGANVQVTALSNSSGTDGKPGSGGSKMVYGFDRKASLLGGGLASQLLFAPGSSAMKLGYEYGGAKNGVSANFQRAEKSFTSTVGRNFNFTDPSQKFSVAGRLRTASWFGANISRNENRDLTGKGASEQNIYALSLGGSSKTMPLVNVSRQEDTTTNAANAQVEKTIDKADLTASLGGAAAVGAKMQRVITDTPDAKSDTTAQETAVSLTAASKDKKTQASLSVTGATTETAASREDKQGVALKLTPSPTVTLSAEQKSQTTTVLVDGKEPAEKTTTTQSAGAEIKPGPNTKITGTILSTEQGDTKVGATDWGAQIGVGKPLEIAGGFTNRSNSGPDSVTLDTTRARVSLRPMSGVTVTGGYTMNPEDQGKVTEAIRQEFTVNARVGAMELGTGYAITTLNGIEDASDGNPQFGQVSLTLGLRFDKSTKLSGRYQDGFLYGSAAAQPSSVAPRGTRIYGLGFARIIGSDLNFNLNGTMTNDRTAGSKPTDYKAEAKVGLKF